MDRLLRPLWLEALPGIALAVFLVITSHLDASAEPERRALDAGADVVLAACGLTLSLHRRAPVAGYLLCLALMVAFFALGYTGGPIYVAPLATLLPVVAERRPRVWVPAALTGTALLTIVGGTTEGWDAGVAAAALVWTILPVAFAGVMRLRREQVAVQEARARGSAAEERLQMARELHDVVGHALSTISLHAGVADRAIDGDPERARESVAAIRQSSKQALGELRAVLGILRAGQDAALAPTPSLDAIPDLVGRMRDAGLRVDLEDGRGRPAERLPDVVGAAAYRIVQESLTNVARHAGPSAAARVRLAAGARGVEVEVRDDGAGADAGWRPGDGIAGMRERASALGGELHAGPAAGGGFHVRGRLPA